MLLSATESVDITLGYVTLTRGVRAKRIMRDTLGCQGRRN